MIKKHNEMLTLTILKHITFSEIRNYHLSVHLFAKSSMCLVYHLPIHT